MSNKCIDEAIGEKLSVLGYSFSNSPTKLQKIYKRHLEECSYCSKQMKESHSRRELNHKLLIAIENGDKDKVILLLEEGADVNTVNPGGIPILVSAARYGYKELVKILLEGHADVNASDSKLRTALYWAAKFGHKEVVELLLQEGAHTEASAFYGRTPVSVAHRAGHKEIVELLSKHVPEIEIETSKLPNYTLSPYEELGELFCSVAYLIMLNSMEGEPLWMVMSESLISHSSSSIIATTREALQFLIDGGWVELAYVDGIDGKERPVAKHELKAVIENPTFWERPKDKYHDLQILLMPTDEGCAHWYEDGFSILGLDEEKRAHLMLVDKTELNLNKRSNRKT